MSGGHLLGKLGLSEFGRKKSKFRELLVYGLKPMAALSKGMAFKIEPYPFLSTQSPPA
jgi:hypothetical protein